ncbi:MAG TPA: hypothetical protein VF426_10450 [Marmoricola sp.]
MARSIVRPRQDWLTGLRRGAWAFVLGVVLLLIAIPAIEDLHALLQTLGIALIVLGGIIVLATVYLRERPAS